MATYNDLNTIISNINTALNQIKPDIKTISFSFGSPLSQDTDRYVYYCTYSNGSLVKKTCVISVADPEFSSNCYISDTGVPVGSIIVIDSPSELSFDYYSYSYQTCINENLRYYYIWAVTENTESSEPLTLEIACGN